MRLVIILVVSISLITHIRAQSGEEIFKSVCASCHTINKGKLVGPDLSQVYNKQNMPWLTSFIRSSQQMIKANDPDAVAIYNQFNHIPMPDNNLSDQQIASIIDYIKSVDQSQASGKATDSTTAVKDSTAIPSDSSAQAATDTISTNEKLVQTGRLYFYGRMPFANSTATCVSCHNIDDGSLLGGGKLALDLSGSYTRLGAAGITAILKNPPFPAMKSAIQGGLTDYEINSLNSLLKSTALRATPINNFTGISFIVLGFLGALFLGTFLFLVYDERKIPRGIKI